MQLVIGQVYKRHGVKVGGTLPADNRKLLRKKREKGITGAFHVPPTFTKTRMEITSIKIFLYFNSVLE
ncbi:MAG: hypothetical protein AOA66_0690 [Candidatus Bathyarchaeota archaeon BA2]|nr:MAG: hypothetical protein AOA66_0690 [Candidatus Bathyarchaeota archaeon BA2]